MNRLKRQDAKITLSFIKRLVARERHYISIGKTMGWMRLFARKWLNSFTRWTSNLKRQ